MSVRSRLAIVAWLCSIAFMLRYVFGPQQSFGEHQYLEYIVPYLSSGSLLQMASLALLWPFAKHAVTFKNIAIILLFAALGVLNAPDTILAIWWLAILILFVWSYYAIVVALRLQPRLWKFLLIVILLIGSIEAVFGILQFALQHDLGLQFLGEPSANQNTLGVAKIIMDGKKMLRPFGTFPHSNVYAGFLVACLLALLSHYKAWRDKEIFLINIGLGLITLGIFFSYSRSAWVAASLTLLWHGISNGWKRLAVPIATAIAVGIFFGASIFGRLEISNQQAQLDLRSHIATVTIESIQKSPLLGSGFRSYIPLALSISPYLESYYYQPPHNVVQVLLIEIGLVGLALLVFCFAALAAQSRKYRWLLILVVIFSLGTLDHYLVTLFQGIGILLLIFLGLIVPRGTISQDESLLRKTE